MQQQGHEGTGKDAHDPAAAALRTAAAAHVHGQASDAEWRAAIRLMCRDAKRGGTPPEQLLVRFKAALADACDSSRMPYGLARVELMNRVVRACIEEYYAEDGDQAVTGLADR